MPGPAKFNGCPDTDGDGVPDHLDECPKTPGTIANKGCPEIKKEEKAILTQAFENLEFESGRAIIRRSSYASLDKLAALLVARPDWKVKLTGHTDNTGIAGNNMELSKNRAQSVKDYLISKGVKEYHIITEWFGQTRPIADNNTAEGRQKNRRVEMDIVFE
ncbi:Outer membrane porin F [anaerobic digester metagenome]